MSVAPTQAGSRTFAMVSVAFIAIGWAIWHPLGAVLLVFSIGNLRALVQRNALFWESPKYAVVFGLLVGMGSGGLVQLASKISFHSAYGALGIAVLGFLAVGYIGYGIPTDPLFQDGAQQLELVTKVVAVSTYVLVTAAGLGWAFTHGWYENFRPSTPQNSAAPSAARVSRYMPRSVENFLFGIDALTRADARPPGIDGDQNVHRVAAILREAIDSAVYIDRAELNAVHPGLGDHFLDDGVRHMRMIAQIEATRDGAPFEQAMASYVAWQRWWNANRSETMAAIAFRYSR